MRCPLLVPCASAAALAAAARSGADALIFDLGGADAAAGRPERRRRLRDALSAGGAFLRVPRVAPLASPLIEDDLDAAMAGAPDAILLPGAVGAHDVQHLAAKLAVREAERGLPLGRIRIVALAADTARGALALGSLPAAGPRLAAVAFDGVALARDVGAAWGDAAPCRLARAAVPIAARAAGVPALDFTPAADGLARACADARRDGYSGLLARRAEEVAAVRAIFGP